MSNKLVHYSRQSGLKILDPEFMGTGAPSEELRQGPVQTKQTSFYREGTEPESIVAGGAKSKYTVNLGPEHKLYDIYEDPEGLVDQSVKQTGRINTDHIRGTLKNAGYHGFYTSHPSYSKQGVVNIFHPMPISSEEEFGKTELKKSPYGPKGAGLYSITDNARRKMSRTSEDIGWGPNRAVHSSSPSANQQATIQAKEYKQKSKKNPVKIYSPEEIKSFQQTRLAASENIEKGFITIKSEKNINKAYSSEAQRRWAHTATGTKALGGKKAVKEWDTASRGLDLPEKMAKSITQGFYRSSLKMSQKDALKSNLQRNNNISAQNLNKSSDHGIINTVTEEELMKANLLRNSLIAGALSFSGANISPVSNQVPKNINVKQGITQRPKDDFGDKMLRTVAAVESAGNTNYDHKTVTHGLNAGQTAAGAYGLMPITTVETIKKNPILNKKYGHVLKMAPNEVKSALEKDPKMQDEIARAHLDRLRRIFGNNPQTIGYAWLQGVTKTKRDIANGVDIKSHWHVQKIMKQYNKK